MRARFDGRLTRTRFPAVLMAMNPCKPGLCCWRPSSAKESLAYQAAAGAPSRSSAEMASCRWARRAKGAEHPYGCASAARRPGAAGCHFAALNTAWRTRSPDRVRPHRPGSRRHQAVAGTWNCCTTPRHSPSLTSISTKAPAVSAEIVWRQKACADVFASIWPTSQAPG